MRADEVLLDCEQERLVLGELDQLTLRRCVELTVPHDLDDEARGSARPRERSHPEAAAILMKLQSQTSVRPMTHDLVSDMLEQLGASISRITVTELRENTFYAQITVIQDGQEIEVDSRPSDAIALAIRAEAPIFAADDVIAESAIEFEGEEVDEEQLEAEVLKFRSFLEDVTPDQFVVENGDEED